MTTPTAMTLEEMLEHLRYNGPSRVVINAEGEAWGSRRAREQLGIVPDIIFFRYDGWSLASTSDLEHVAYDMWRGDWVGFIRRGDAAISDISSYAQHRVLENERDHAE